LVAGWLTLVALPILAIDNIPRMQARAASDKVAVVHPLDPSTTVASVVPTDVATSVATTVTAPTTPPPAADEATTAARPLQAPAKTPAPATVTTAPPTAESPPPTTESPPPPAALNEQQGGASWYDYNSGECAHRSISRGTVVTVTSLSTGASVTCVVTDRGPYGGGRIIDLDRGTFAQLADPGAGVIGVRITW